MGSEKKKQEIREFCKLLKLRGIADNFEDIAKEVQEPV